MPRKKKGKHQAKCVQLRAPYSFCSHCVSRDLAREKSASNGSVFRECRCSTSTAANNRRLPNRRTSPPIAHHTYTTWAAAVPTRTRKHHKVATSMFNTTAAPASTPVKSNATSVLNVNGTGRRITIRTNGSGDSSLKSGDSTKSESASEDVSGWQVPKADRQGPIASSDGGGPKKATDGFWRHDNGPGDNRAQFVPGAEGHTEGAPWTRRFPETMDPGGNGGFRPGQYAELLEMAPDDHSAVAAAIIAAARR